MPPKRRLASGRKPQLAPALETAGVCADEVGAPGPAATIPLAGLALGPGPASSPSPPCPSPSGPSPSGPGLTALRQHGEVIRRRTIELANGVSIDTDSLKAKELRRLATLHPDAAEQIQAALDAGEFRTSRVRKKHNLSDGESEEDQPVYTPSDRSYFRSLREEEQPEIHGLRPPRGHDSTITARAHVTAGTKARVKSQYVSASHSMRVSGAWGASDGSRIAKFQAPEGSDFYDLMDPTDQGRVGLTGTGLNAAKGSQEVLIGGGLGPEYVQAIYTAEQMSVGDYKAAGGAGSSESEARFRTRTVATGNPRPVKMRKIYDREKSSEARLRRARDYWDIEIADTVEQVNDQFSHVEDFQPVDAYDVTEFLTDYLRDQAGAEEPYRLDYISNDNEYDQYITVINAAIRAYIGTFS
jgi:hypothetical protein